MAVPTTLTEPPVERPAQPEQMFKVDRDERDGRGSSEDFRESYETRKRAIRGRDNHFSTGNEAAHSEDLVANISRKHTDRLRLRKALEHATSLASELGMSREQFYIAALSEYIGKIENEKATRELNESYEGVDQSSEVEVLNYLVDHYDLRLADE